MTNQTIICPRCKNEISIDDAIGHQLEEKYRLEFEAKQRQKDQEINEKEKALAEKEKQIEAGRQNLSQIVAQRVSEGVKAKETEIEKKAAEDAESKYKQILEDKNKKITELSDAQIKLMQDREKLEDEKRTFTLEMKKKEEEITNSVRQEMAKETGEKHQLELAELKKQLDDARKMNAELDQKLKQGSQQNQGEVLELELEELLSREFPSDEITPVAKGVNGADITQKVIDKFGQICGTIVWETKRTKNWIDGWIPKLKDDQRDQRAEVAVLVTTVLPKDIKNFSVKDGVWVSDFTSAIGLASVLRSGVISVHAVKQASVGKNEKMEILYNYLSGVEFKQKIEAIVDSFTDMKSDLDREKRAMKKIWETREKQIDRVVDNTVGMYGDLGGLMGRALPRIEALELPEGEK